MTNKNYLIIVPSLIILYIKIGIIVKFMIYMLFTMEILKIYLMNIKKPIFLEQRKVLFGIWLEIH